MQQTKELGHYLFQKTIGEGTFAKVKLAVHQPTNQPVAIKVLNKTKITDVSDVERINRQIHILKLVRHSNIIQLYQIIQTPKHLFFVMEYCENGQLFKYIVDNGKLREQEACKLYEQLISGLEYLHKLHISHRDLKTQNLLLDHGMNLKIVDFGLANTYNKEETLKTPCGSQVYAAPQILQGQNYNGQMVDIWSSGIILFAMVCGYLPFQDDDPLSLTKKILYGKYNLPSNISPQLKDLLEKILNKDHRKRYTIEKIRSHPWMNKHLSINSNRNKGIVVGYNKIPIDSNILKKMGKQYNPQYVSKCLEANRHNSITTNYYLTLKKHIKNGGDSSSDLSSINFNANPLKSQSRSRQRLKKNISFIQENKQNISFNNQKIQVQINTRKSISKKTSLNLHPAKLHSILYPKQCSNAVTHKYIKPTKINRLNQSIVSKGSKKGKQNGKQKQKQKQRQKQRQRQRQRQKEKQRQKERDKYKSKSIDPSQRCSLQKIPLSKMYISTKVDKPRKRIMSQQRNKSIIINQTFVSQHLRQKSSGEIKKKVNESLLNRPSLNLKKKK